MEIKELENRLKEVEKLIPNALVLKSFSFNDLEKLFIKITEELGNVRKNVLELTIEEQISNGNLKEYIPFAESDRETKYRKNREEFIKYYTKDKL